MPKVPLCSDGFSGFIKGLSDADIHNREIVYEIFKVISMRCSHIHFKQGRSDEVLTRKSHSRDGISDWIQGRRSY